MSENGSIWITIYSANPQQQSEIIKKLQSHFEKIPRVICIGQEKDYNRDNDVEFLAHSLYVLNRLLNIEPYPSPVVIADVSIDYILKKIDNFDCPALTKNIEELYSAVRCNEFVFFSGFESKWDCNFLIISDCCWGLAL